MCWAEDELKPKAALAIKGEGEFCTGDHCRFCRVRATCTSPRPLKHTIGAVGYPLPTLGHLFRTLLVGVELKFWRIIF